MHACHHVGNRHLEGGNAKTVLPQHPIGQRIGTAAGGTDAYRLPGQALHRHQQRLLGTGLWRGRPTHHDMELLGVKCRDTAKRRYRWDPGCVLWDRRERAREVGLECDIVLHDGDRSRLVEPVDAGLAGEDLGVLE